MDGLQDLTKINDRITKERAERVMFESLLARSQQGDMQAMAAITEIYRNPNKIDDILEEFFSEQVEQQQEQQAAASSTTSSSRTRTIISTRYICTDCCRSVMDEYFKRK